MIQVTLDGKEMINRTRAHLYIGHKLNMPDYYGKNLDALWDVLSTCDKTTKINLINKENLLDYLGDYGNSIIKVFKDAEKENNNIDIKIKS